MFSALAVSDSLARMDSKQEVSTQKTANLAQIENPQNSREMLNLTRASVVFGAISAICAIIAVWPSPDRGGSMINWIWIPAIILGLGSLSTATALVIVAFKRWRYKKLAKLTAQLQGELTQAKSDLELEQAKPKFVLDTAKIDSLNATLQAAKESANKLQTENNVLEDELRASKASIDQLEKRNAILVKEAEMSKDGIQKSEIALSLAKIRESELQAKLQAESLRADGEATHQAHATNRVNELEREQAIWEPIIKQARDQAAQIDEWVRMKTAIPRKLLLKKRIVTLAIRIHNNSLFAISIHPKDVKGSLVFKTEPLKEEIEMVIDDPSIWPLEPSATAIIKLRQPLRIFEAEKVQEASEGADEDALFWLGNLYIPISAKDTPVLIRALPLIINPDYIGLDIHKFSYHK